MDFIKLSKVLCRVLGFDYTRFTVHVSGSLTFEDNKGCNLRVTSLDLDQLLYSLSNGEHEMTNFITEVEILNQYKAQFKRKLRSGVHTFAFEKADGSTRLALGTLNQDLYDYEFKGGGSPESDSTIRYWDMQKMTFRAFRIDRAMQIAS